MENSNVQEDIKLVKEFLVKYDLLKSEISKVIIGQEKAIEMVLISIFSRGHCLLVGVPGLAKTLLIKTISETLGLQFSRIQFTPDLMPSDIIGSEILDENRKFKFIEGPLFANIILADEINRTPPKTQSALLEAMQEKAVTAAGRTYKLGEPFFVLATQNPIEQEGTYPLPEAQLDRFMFNIWVYYPAYQEEVDVVKNTPADNTPNLGVVLNAEEILRFQSLVRRIPVTTNVMEYAVKLSSSTRPGNSNSPELISKYISWGAGPRASQYLIIGAKCHALLHGKYSPDIEDVNAISFDVLRHRIVRNYKAEAEGKKAEDIIAELLD